jgi:uncharacterized delta-60 repeat protein
MAPGHPADRGEPLVRLVGWNRTTRATRPAGHGGTGLAEAARLTSIAVIAAAGAAGEPALAAPGDLDPAFGEVGRVVDLDAFGQLWSLEVQDDEAVQFAGGEYCGYYYECDSLDLLGRVDAFGAPDATFVAGDLDDTYVYDTALLDDGRLVGTGYARLDDGRVQLTVFRLLSSGALDPTFGLGGKTVYADGDVGFSVLVDGDGKVVVAGIRNGELIVARFLANGLSDAGFGTQGAFHLGTPKSVGHPMHLASAPGGGYRVLGNLVANADSQCSIVGVTAGGTQDVTFGSGGVLVAPVPGPSRAYCTAFSVLPGGDMLVAGTAGSAGYAVRLNADGTVDPAFDSTPVADRLVGVSALAVGGSGKIFVAGPDGSDRSGATIVRLLASGALDPAFGQGGTTTVDPQTLRPRLLVVQDMQARANDALVLAGNTGPFDTPVIARLLGDVGQSGPGVLGLVEQSTLVTEQDGQAVVKVRRTGGAGGTVGVAWVARAVEDGAATAGGDFSAVTGELAWPDGDVTEREIVVPITADAEVERPEWFEVVLQSPTGGAGLGATGTQVDIAGASYPHGDFAFVSTEFDGAEGAVRSLSVNRLSYGQGPVSVEVRVSGGDATLTTDFALSGSASGTVVLSWAEGEIGQKSFNVELARDTVDEATETIEFELASPTGGALLGDPSQASMSILDTPPVRDDRGGGGGVFTSIESVLLLLLAAMRRAWVRANGAAGRFVNMAG